MKNPILSKHFQEIKPSVIRIAQILFSKRKEKIDAINTAIGNVSLPMHPAMQRRMFNLDTSDSPFKTGVVGYTATIGMEETNKAFLNIIASSGFSTKGLFTQITDGGSQAMELVILGTCGRAGTNEKPLLLIDPAYTNYLAMAKRLGRKTVSVMRVLNHRGEFALPDLEKIEKIIVKNKPGAIVVIPYDNPTGQHFDNKTMIKLAKLCVKYNLWMISDEAYRELCYDEKEIISIWKLSEKDVQGIKGRRISIESSSKVWNACGLRIGAIVTDNKLFHEQCVAENTANLCSNAIGQYIFGSLANESHSALQKWYRKQRKYYKAMLTSLTNELEKKVPGIIVSIPAAAIYSVIDVRNVTKPGFDAAEFVKFCATKGKVKIGKHNYTLLVAPMNGFYSVRPGEKNPGKTQMRIAYVEKPERIQLVPELFAKLLKEYEKANSNSGY